MPALTSERPSTAVINARLLLVVDEAGGEITAEDLCAELRRRGWAFDDLSPARLGMEPDAIIRRATE